MAQPCLRAPPPRPLATIKERRKGPGGGGHLLPPLYLGIKQGRVKPLIRDG